MYVSSPLNQLFTALRVTELSCLTAASYNFCGPEKLDGCEGSKKIELKSLFILSFLY